MTKRLLVLAALGSSVAVPVAAQDIRVAPSMRAGHSHRNPDLTIQTHTFLCGGSERRFAIAFDIQWRPQFLSASRDGAEPRFPDLMAAAAVVRRFTSITRVVAQCSDPVDRITIHGYIDGRFHQLFVDWRGREIVTYGPEPIPPPPH